VIVIIARALEAIVDRRHRSVPTRALVAQRAHATMIHVTYQSLLVIHAARARVQSPLVAQNHAAKAVIRVTETIKISTYNLSTKYSPSINLMHYRNMLKIEHFHFFFQLFCFVTNEFKFNSLLNFSYLTCTT
jgi:hypothetical protein